MATQLRTHELRQHSLGGFLELRRCRPEKRVGHRADVRRRAFLRETGARNIVLEQLFELTDFEVRELESAGGSGATRDLEAPAHLDHHLA